MPKSISNVRFFLSFLLSICITGFGRASDVPSLSFLAATLGYVPLWSALIDSSFYQKKNRLCLWLLYFCSSLIQTRWLLSHPFDYIIGIWFFLNALLSIPYALITAQYLNSFIENLTYGQNRLSRFLTSLFAFAALFALFDMCEPHLVFFGISFRSVGAFFMANLWTSQLITLLGGAGLTFFVICMNGSFLILLKRGSSLLSSLCLFLVPLMIGGVVYLSLPTYTRPTPVKVAIFHFNEPAHLDETVDSAIESYRHTFFKIFAYLKKIETEHPDIIVIPEGMIPFALDTQLMTQDELPQKLRDPFLPNKFVSTQEIAQKLSDVTHASVLLGAERKEVRNRYEKPCIYNSSFLFSPHTKPQFYDKRVLVPGGEFIPFEDLLKPLLTNYGISGSFQPGTRASLFTSPHVSLFPLICYEETLTENVLPATKLPVDFLVSMSNDHWFPIPQFAKEHWLLGKMRAMEAGVSLIRSTNMGQSGIIVADGREVLINTPSNKDQLLIQNVYPERRWTPFSSLTETRVVLFFLIIMCFGWRQKGLSTEQQYASK